MDDRPRAVPPARRRLRAATALTAALLLGGLVAGLVAGARGSGPVPATTTAAGGHHGAPLSPAAPTEPPETGTPTEPHGDHPATDPATDPATAHGATALAGGHSADDHGDLEVTVVLGEDGTSSVRGPVRPGAWFSFVNRTSADQVLTTDDGTMTVDVPLVRLVTVRAPTTPGTYRLVSGTDSTVAVELVVA